MDRCLASLIESRKRGEISRRQFLRVAASIVGYAAAATLLASCEKVVGSETSTVRPAEPAATSISAAAATSLPPTEPPPSPTPISPTATPTVRRVQSAYVVTRLCLRGCDSACVQVCPVECIVPGRPEEEWPWYYIDVDSCIKCGACVPECPYGAIFLGEELPVNHVMQAGTEYVLHDGTRMVAQGDEVFDLTEDAEYHILFFAEGPGYSALIP